MSDRNGRQNPRRKRQDQTEGAKQEDGGVQSLSGSRRVGRDTVEKGRRKQEMMGGGGVSQEPFAPQTSGKASKKSKSSSSRGRTPCCVD